MSARLVYSFALLTLVAPAVSAQDVNCASSFQPLATLNAEGAVVLELQATRAECLGKGQLTGWEVSADGRIFEPAHNSPLLNSQNVEGARLQANTNSPGLFMFRPVFDFGAGPVAGEIVPISVASPGKAKFLALRIPQMTKETVAPVAATGIDATTTEEARPFANSEKGRLDDLANNKGPHVVSGNITGGGSGTSGVGGAYSAPATNSTPSSLNNNTAAVVTQSNCKQVFTFQSPSNVTIEAPAPMTLTGAQDSTGDCSGAAVPVFNFQTSSDGRTYVALDKAGYATDLLVNMVYTDARASFTLLAPGKYYFRLQVVALGKTQIFGPTIATIIAPIPTGPPPAVGSLPGYVGGKLEASQGSVTDGITLSWNPSPTTYTYNVYRWDATAVPPAYVKLTSAPLAANGYTDNVSDILVRKYVVRSVDTKGVESSDSLPATGYANAVPTAVTANMTAFMNKTTDQFHVSVLDANFTAGQVEDFKIAILTQPPAGQGTATAVGNGLVWQPPSDFSFLGTTTFTFRLTDKGGASIVGTANVAVSHPPPPAPVGFIATQGTITDRIKFTWKPMVGFAEYIATGYNIYNVDVVPPVKVNPTPILDTTYEYTTPNHAGANYQLRAITTVGESLPTKPLWAYSNAAIQSASVPTIIATAITQSAATPIAVVDENTLLGQGEIYLVAIVNPPPVGVATVTGDGKLVWTPPKEHSFSGTTHFSFSVTDKGNASVIGEATVQVAPAATKALVERSSSTALSGSKPSADQVAAEAAAFACAKKFTLLPPAVANKATPLQVQLTLLKNADLSCGAAPLDVVFEASTDNKNYLPVLTAPFVTDAQIAGDSATTQAQLVLPSRGLYYFRVQALTSNRAVVIGPVKVIAP